VPRVASVRVQVSPPSDDAKHALLACFGNVLSCRDDCALSSGEGLASSGTFAICNAGGIADVIIDFMGFHGLLTSYMCDGDCLRASRTTTAGASMGLVLVGRRPCHSHLTRGLEGLTSQSEVKAWAPTPRTVGKCPDGVKYQLGWHRRQLHCGGLLTRVWFDDCIQLARLQLEVFQY